MRYGTEPSLRRSRRLPMSSPLMKGSLLALATVFSVWVLGRTFLFLRDAALPQWFLALAAIVWGVGGSMLLFTLLANFVEQFPPRWRRGLVPLVFVGPAAAIVVIYLALPALRTLIQSFYDAKGENFVGLANYVYAFTSQEMLVSFRNNFLFWLLFGTGFSVILGLIVAVLADRTHPVFERIVKAVIFMPMAISMVGASVIWKFVYEYRPAGVNQIGLLNAVLTALGGEPRAWLLTPFWNNLFLVAIFIWLQTGFAMVVFSAAIKAVPEELLEAGRIDGANEVQVFLHITLPNIRGSVLTVTTTIILVALKIFDIVQSMTGGNYGTQVIANVQYTQMFRLFNYGRAAAVAMVLLAVVLPIMIYNLRDFSKRTEAF
ncbi:MAG: sugar ABC transporter permease [Symbiobacterium sp.]|uniref:carbohydrate ABC transporter permease n=1 Tax=Symbiobacterium sp. TaxID=1971213 RepID=UPI003464160F